MAPSVSAELGLDGYRLSDLCSTVSVTEQMTTIRKRSETSVIGQIADDLLSWVRPD